MFLFSYNYMKKLHKKCVNILCQNYTKHLRNHHAHHHVILVSYPNKVAPITWVCVLLQRSFNITKSSESAAEYQVVCFVGGEALLRGLCEKALRRPESCPETQRQNTKPFKHFISSCEHPPTLSPQSLILPYWLGKAAVMEWMMLPCHCIVHHTRYLKQTSTTKS